MAGRKLRTYVHVDGQVYGPDSDVPTEVAKRIENPKAWEGYEEGKAEQADTSRKPARRTSES
jgi:hypothetical protein